MYVLVRVGVYENVVRVHRKSAPSLGGPSSLAQGLLLGACERFARWWSPIFHETGAVGQALRGVEAAEEILMSTSIDEVIGRSSSNCAEGGIRTCAWCGDQAVDAEARISLGERISHVICADCLQNQLEALHLPVPEAA